MSPRRWLTGVIALSLTSVLSACGGGVAPSSTAQTAASVLSSSSPCGWSADTARYKHVMWVFMENKSYASVISSRAAPYENALAGACGLATEYQGVAHPSLPNYLAATGGSTFGVTSDGSPDSVAIKASSIFSEVSAAGLQWRSYEESMPGNCTLQNSGLYAVRHNPAAYYVPLRNACNRYDVPMGTLQNGPLASALSSDTLPAFSFVTPNVCDDMHDCSVAAGDTWLARFMGAVLGSPAYKSGSLVVVITWDEGVSNNHVPTIVVSPTTRPGTKVATGFDHYSLLRTTEELLHLPLLGQSRDSSSMLKAFDL